VDEILRTAHRFCATTGSKLTRPHVRAVRTICV